MLALLIIGMFPAEASIRQAPPPSSGAEGAAPLPLVCSLGSGGRLQIPNTTGSPPAVGQMPPAPASPGRIPYRTGNRAATLPVSAEMGPVLVRVTPMHGRPGDVVTLEGHRFGPDPQVLFKAIPARILSHTDTLITAVVPASTTYPLVVETAHGAADTPEPFVYVVKTENDVLYPVPVGDGRWFPQHSFWDGKPVDPIARFLQYYWDQPLPPQGQPPASFSALEADLRPESCASCHPAQHQDWKGALHSQTASRLLRWTLRDKSPSEANDCRRCHDPAAEPGAWTAVELYRTPDDPRQVLPRRDGVQCAVCHVRAHVRHGPPARPGAAPGGNAPSAHGGFRPEQAFQDSRFCAGCHTFEPRVVPGGLVGDPFEEWRASRFAAEGVSCQNCHMPNRQHLFRGIHDREMTLSGLTIGLEVSRDEEGQATATATVTSTNIGHMFPTYPVPRVQVRLLCDQRPLGEEYVIGRDVDLKQLVENWDRRLAPGESHRMHRRFQPGQEVTLQIDVVPRDRYEKDLRVQLAVAEKVPNHVFLGTVQQLLEHEMSFRYRLVEITVRVPPKAGTVRRVIKEGLEVAEPANP